MFATNAQPDTQLRSSLTARKVPHDPKLARISKREPGRPLALAVHLIGLTLLAPETLVMEALSSLLLLNEQ